MNASEAAAALGRIGGKSTSDAKRAASRANGRKGGRRKQVAGTTGELAQAPAAIPNTRPLLLLPTNEDN